MSVSPLLSGWKKKFIMACCFCNAVWNLDIGQQAAWNSIQAYFGPGAENERWMFTVCLVLAHSATFFAINTFYFLLDAFFQESVERFRFQAYKHPPRELVFKCIAYVTMFHVAASFSPYVLFPYALAHNPQMFTMPVPGLGKLFAQLVLCYVTTDFFFYWAHRMLHTPFFYQRVHKQHHQFRVSIGFACEYAHPFELVVGNVLPVIAGPVLFKMPFFVFVVWLTVAILGTSWGHSGFMFPIALTRGHHDFHHSHNVGNFGSMPYWDYFMGTDKAYKEFLAREAKGQNAPIASEIGDGIKKKQVANGGDVTPRSRSRSASKGKKKQPAKSRSTSTKRR